MSKSTRSNITEADLDILGGGGDEHVRGGQGGHGSPINLARHLEIHHNLSGVGVPDIDVVIEGASDEQSSVHRVPDGGGNSILVRQLVLLVHEKQTAVLGYEATGFVLGGALHVEDGDGGICGSG